MANTISDMTAALFRQLDRLDNADGDEAINAEIGRARAVMGVASSISEAYRLELDIVKTRAELTAHANAAREAARMDRMLAEKAASEEPYYKRQRDADAEVDERSNMDAVRLHGRKA